MHPLSRRAQEVSIPRADCLVRFEAEEYIWTENSYEHTPEEVVARGRAAGFRSREQWSEPYARFALALFVVD